MIVGDLNILVCFLILLLFSVCVNTNSMLNLLLTTELLWVTLYLISLLTGLWFDNLNLLALTFFLLIFSATELSIGLILLVLMNLIARTINLNSGDMNFNKYLNRFFGKLYLNKIKWKI